MVGNAAEIIGKVDANLNVKVLASTDFGQGIGESDFTGSS